MATWLWPQWGQNLTGRSGSAAPQYRHCDPTTSSSTISSASSNIGGSSGTAATASSGLSRATGSGARWKSSCLGAERTIDPVGSQQHRYVLEPVDHLEIRVGTPDLFLELESYCLGVGANVAALARAEAEQYHLVLFARIHLERAAVSAIGDDGEGNLGQRHGFL